MRTCIYIKFPYSILIYKDMIASKHNIISRVKDSNDYFIVNLLSQNADIISSEEAEILQSDCKEAYPDQFIERGYIVDPKEEQKHYKQQYLEFIDARDNDEIQLFFVPTYACNFSCSYCYQDEYAAKAKPPDEKILDAFFAYVDTKFKNRNKYITVFGGEPLLNSRDHKSYIQKLLQKASERELDVAFVTNGYYLESYIDTLNSGRIREVQVTLDGTAETHDKRRMLRGGANTFNQIANGINQALKAGIAINLRMVIDKTNIDELPKLAQYAIESGWTQSPLFKTQLGRNYELHHCQSHEARLYSRINMYEDIYDLLKKYPHIKEFHKPAFSVAKYLFEQGTLPVPLFDSCPGTKTEWAFDYTGKVYSCTATVGKPGEELGTFYPKIELKEELIEEWEDRDILSIDKCTQCELRLACGGGCASVAKNNTGKINSPDCRPVKELLELGVGHYFRD